MIFIVKFVALPSLPHPLPFVGVVVVAVSVK